MRRLVYSPKAYVYIQTDQGVYNISDLVVAGSVHRKVDQVSTAEVTFQNPDFTFTQAGAPTFRPMDKITIFLQRLPGFPVQSFTGYLDESPYFQMYPGTVSLRASCTLKRLKYSYFDPGLPFMTQFFARYGWQSDTNGTIKNPSSVGVDTSDPGANQYAQSASMSGLLFASLKHIAGWDPNDILIESLPEGLVDRIGKIYTVLSEEQEDVAKDFEEWLKSFIGTSATGDGGMAPGDVTLGGVQLGNLDEEQNKVLDGIVSTGRAMNVPRKYILAAIATGLVEDNLHNQASERDHDSQNWRQERRSGYGDEWAKTGGSLNITAIARRYYNECKALDRGQSAGELAADVQRPAAQYRGRYAERMPDAEGLLAAYEAESGSKNTNGDEETGSETQTKNNRKDGSDAKDFATPVKGLTDANSWPGSMGSWGASRSYGSHAGVDIPAGLGVAYQAITDGTVVAVTNSWSEGSGCVGIRPSVRIQGYPENIRLFYGGTQSISVKVGDQVKAGQAIASGGTHGSGPHLHFFVRQDDTPSNGSLDPTPLAKAAVKGTAPSSGPADGGTDSGSTGTGGTDALVAAKAAGVFTTLNFPQAVASAESMLLRGDRSLMNDQPLLPFIEQLSKGTLRSFMTLPNGDFYAFHPDYFGAFGTAPYWEIDDIEVLDGDIQLSDDALATHVFVTGNTLPNANDPTLSKLYSLGVVTILNAGASDFINNTPGEEKDGELQPFLGSEEASLNFLQRYGARPLIEDAPFIRSHIFETFYAYQTFMLAWSRQFLTTFSFTFMPEIYPGGIVQFKDHGIQMYVDEVHHSWDYTSGFTTQANLSAPSAVGAGNSQISRGMIRDGNSVLTPPQPEGVAGYTKGEGRPD